MAVLMALAAAVPALAQSLSAAQMNIYYGHPKTVTMTNQQGTVITELDRQGRVTQVTQGNMRMTYAWSDDGKSVEMSMYQGQNFVDSGTIEILEFTPARYKYNIGGTTEVTVDFRPNGSIEKMTMVNPQMTGSMTYYYNSDDDMYPCAIEQEAGGQSMKVAMTIEGTDDHGNLTAYSGELMGNKQVTTQTIEYYE